MQWEVYQIPPGGRALANLGIPQDLKPRTENETNTKQTEDWSGVTTGDTVRI